MESAEIIKKEGVPVYASWQAPEFEKHSKSPSWFLTAAIIGLALFSFSLLMHNFVFAFLVILMVFTVFIYALKEPRIIDFKIDGQGVWIEKKLYSFGDIRSFWVFTHSVKELSIQSRRKLLPYIKMPLGDQDPSEIRELLVRFILEERQEESILDNLSRFFRF